MTLGQRISQYRKDLGLSQEELGERLDVSRQAVSKWETGAAVPDMENLLALSRLFGVSLSELTATPEASPAPAPEAPRTSQRGWWAAVWGMGVLILAGIGLLFYLSNRISAGQIGDRAEPIGSDFYLIWQVPRWDGREWWEWLALGTQEESFPFGTSLTPTKPETVLDTDFGGVTAHQVDCGALHLAYAHIAGDPKAEPAVPDQEILTELSTIVPGYFTARNIEVGTSKEDVLIAYGDDLVYCLKEDSYTLVPHEYYYAFQTPQTGGDSLCLFMAEGQVVGIRLANLDDLGCEAYAPDQISRFPLVDGEPDFSMRQEPQQEDVDATRQVYIAWNELLTASNLSAEERYQDRWTIFSLLSDLDWQAFGELGGTEYPQQTVEALMAWLQEQAPYTDDEIFRLQMGCTAQGLDGAYTDLYCHLLSTAFFQNPAAFAKRLACDSTESTMIQAIRFTAYDADLYPVELETALDTLDSAIASGAFTKAELGWAELLRLYLITPVSDRSQLPDSPAGLNQ